MAVGDLTLGRRGVCCLKLGFVKGRAIHVVVGYDAATDTGHVVTAYEPDPIRWQSDLKTTKRP